MDKKIRKAVRTYLIKDNMNLKINCESNDKIIEILEQ